MSHIYNALNTTERLIEHTLSFFAPFDCLGCGREGSLLCGYCQSEHVLPVPERCFGCSKLSEGYRTCKQCKQKLHLASVWVCTEYEGVPKELIRCIKFSRARSGAAVVAAILKNRGAFFPAEAVVVPIPTASSRVRLRGYDQARLIAEVYAKRHSMYYDDLLWRTGQRRQLGSSAARRRAQAEAFFRPRNVSRIRGKHIVLIDDVATTGATLDAAARCLRGSGAKSVSALVFAQRR